MLCVAAVPVVDPDSLSWDIIRELRRDELSRIKLRRLRTFVFENYANKPLSFVKDDLLTRIHDHNSAAKEWGLATVQSTFSIGAVKSVMTAAASGLVAAIAGQPVPIAAALGATAILGATTVSIVASRRQFQLKQAKDPIVYVVDLTKRK